MATSPERDGAFQRNVFGVLLCLLRKHSHYFIITSCVNISFALLALKPAYINSIPSIYFEQMAVLNKQEPTERNTEMQSFSVEIESNAQ